MDHSLYFDKSNQSEICVLIKKKCLLGRYVHILLKDFIVKTADKFYDKGHQGEDIFVEKIVTLLIVQRNIEGSQIFWRHRRREKATARWQAGNSSRFRGNKSFETPFTPETRGWVTRCSWNIVARISALVQVTSFRDRDWKPNLFIWRLCCIYHVRRLNKFCRILNDMSRLDFHISLRFELLRNRHSSSLLTNSVEWLTELIQLIQFTITTREMWWRCFSFPAQTT